ncbi:alpha-2-macroglobulin-like protein, partial [Plakobranchus ocellatus]
MCALAGLTTRALDIPEYLDYGQRPKIRPYFIEPWYWGLVDVGAGEIMFNLTTMKYITTWSAQAVCVSKTKGFGMSEVVSHTVLKPLTVSVKQPYAAVLDERLPVFISIRSSMDYCIWGMVKMVWNHNFLFLEGEDKNWPRRVGCICSDKPYTVTYFIRPRVLGYMDIQVSVWDLSRPCSEQARTGRDISYGNASISDEVHRKILVKAEGVEQSYTYTSYFCSEDGKPLSEEVPLQLPKGKEIIKNSAHGEVQVIGYQEALSFRHKDGSFSAFGDKDPKGSVWLTSFLVKSFARAQKYISIDEHVIRRSVDFLVRSQLESGCFQETGKVFSSYMMGGLGQKRGQKNLGRPQGALTAYVLMALMETGRDINDPIIELGIQCMNRELRARNNYSLDPYTLALVTLANIKYNSTSPDAQFAFETLHEKAWKDDKHIYWKRHTSQPPTTNTKFYPAAPSAEVEMASYALMSYLHFFPNQSEKIAMWLSHQRNSFGGFASTQDTVVALDALSQYAAWAYSRGPAKMKVKIMFKSKAAPSSVEFNVSEGENNTRFLLQSTPIPTLPNTLHIITSGTGCALVQANVHYNEPVRKPMGREKPNFSLNIYVRPYRNEPNVCDHRTLDITVRSLRGHSVSKGMGLLTLQMVTSWSPTPHSLTKLKSLPPTFGIKRVDFVKEEGVLHLYFDEFGKKTKKFNIIVVQDQDLKVAEPKIADARVVEYYET